MRDAKSSETCVLKRMSGKVKYNPSAGDVRAVEISGGWMEGWNDMVSKEGEKAALVLYEKRIFGLK